MHWWHTERDHDCNGSEDSNALFGCYFRGGGVTIKMVRWEHDGEAFFLSTWQIHHYNGNPPRCEHNGFYRAWHSMHVKPRTQP